MVGIASRSVCLFDYELEIVKPEPYKRTTHFACQFVT